MYMLHVSTVREWISRDRYWDGLYHYYAFQQVGYVVIKVGNFIRHSSLNIFKRLLYSMHFMIQWTLFCNTRILYSNGSSQILKRL
jgi:hypothetical protein